MYTYLAYSADEPLRKLPDRGIKLSPSYFREVFRNVKKVSFVQSFMCTFTFTPQNECKVV